jgi:flavin-binding protein dodecin
LNHFYSAYDKINLAFIHLLLFNKNTMSVIKVLELMSSSNRSWEEAAQSAIAEASKTIKNIRSVYVKDHSAVVKNGKIAEYRVNVKLSFEVEPLATGKSH